MALRVRLACGSHVPVASWWFSGAFWTSAALLVSDALDVVLRFPFQVRPHLRPIHWHIVLE